MLKLIVSNTETFTNTLPQALTQPENLAGFSSEIRVKGPGLYVMNAQDPSHYLTCELVLEVEESQTEYESGAVICHFPSIDSEQLSNFICDDESLYGMAMIQFQMNILKQLLLFCATHYASKLIVYTDDAQAEELGIYQEFLSHEGRAFTQSESQTEMIIPSDSKTLENWVAYMDMVTLKFRQTLWQDQRSNPTIKQYLKIYPF